MSGADGTVQEIVQYANKQRQGFVPCVFSTDGRSLYESLAESKGSPKAASEYLNSLGIKGINYPAGSISGAKTSARNFVIFEPEDIKITAEEFLDKD